jgi:hypothetical protein
MRVDVASVEPPRAELDGPYINAPVWPWLTAGWLMAATYVLSIVVAHSYA